MNIGEGEWGQGGVPLSRREINSPPGFGEEEGEEFSHTEETASAKSTPDGDRGRGTKSVDGSR